MYLFFCWKLEEPFYSAYLLKKTGTSDKGGTFSSSAESATDRYPPANLSQDPAPPKNTRIVGLAVTGSHLVEHLGLSFQRAKTVQEAGGTHNYALSDARFPKSSP